MTFQRVQQSLSQSHQAVPKTSSFAPRPLINHPQRNSEQSSSQKAVQAPPVLHEFTNLSINYSHQPELTLTQPKLTIAQPGDKYEQEADRVANQVVQHMQTPPSLQYQMMTGTSAALRMKPEPQLRPDNGGLAAPPALASSIQQARGGGHPLAETVRRPMEQAFGADFSQVRVHTDARSNQLNQSIHAKAFTTKQDIFFRQGAYVPGSPEGQRLIAHELTHVVQQTSGAGTASIQRIGVDQNNGYNDMRGIQTLFESPEEKELKRQENGMRGIQTLFESPEEKELKRQEKELKRQENQQRHQKNLQAVADRQQRREAEAKKETPERSQARATRLQQQQDEAKKARQDEETKRLAAHTSMNAVANAAADPVVAKFRADTSEEITKLDQSSIYDWKTAEAWAFWAACDRGDLEAAKAAKLKLIAEVSNRKFKFNNLETELNEKT